MKETREELMAMVCEMEEALASLEARLCGKAKGALSGRKAQVLALLKKGPISTPAIAERLGITSKNVGSLLSYLKNDDGYLIGKDPIGRHRLES
jgi:biotin operon repressor